MVFIGTNFDADVYLDIDVDFLFCMNPVFPSYSKMLLRNNSLILKLLKICGPDMFLSEVIFVLSHFCLIFLLNFILLCMYSYVKN